MEKLEQGCEHDARLYPKGARVAAPARIAHNPRVALTTSLVSSKDSFKAHFTPRVARLFPFLRWWPRVNRVTLRADAIAGGIGALVVLP